jgi:hypothetical protein
LPKEETVEQGNILESGKLSEALKLSTTEYKNVILQCAWSTLNHTLTVENCYWSSVLLQYSVTPVVWQGLARTEDAHTSISIAALSNNEALQQKGQDTGLSFGVCDYFGFNPLSFWRESMGCMAWARNLLSLPFGARIWMSLHPHRQCSS